MRKLFILFGLLLISNVPSVHAQVLQPDSLIGVWLCEDATLIEDFKDMESMVEAAKRTKTAIISSKFVFKKNGLFEWSLPSDTNPAFKELSFLNNQKWSLNQTGDMVYIGPLKENLMQIIIKKIEGVTYFTIVDMPLLLRVKRQ